MHYEFPKIKNLSDVIPAIDGRDEFIVAERHQYLVINYLVAFEETFKIDENELMENHGVMIPKGIMRRECRGLIFDRKTEELISRPAHKFFNVNERDETQTHVLDFDKDHLILEKLDGSFIRPFVTSDGVLRVGTKMGETDIAEKAKKFFELENYRNFALWCHENNLTPVFEYMSPENRIVVDYGDEERLVLLFIRDNLSGRYVPYK